MEKEGGIPWFMVLMLVISIQQTISGPVRCPQPGADPERYVEESEVTGADTYAPGDWIWFSCNPGYVISEEEEEITCNDEGQWEPLSNPRCRAESCAKPADIPNGQLNAKAQTPVGGLMEIECDPGYELDGAATVECVGDTEAGGWDRAVSGTCKPVTCPDYSLVTLENGRIVMLAGNGVGATLTAVCRDGYTLQGPTTRTCTLAGAWNGTLQICQDGRSKCGDPGTPISGKKYGSSYNLDDTVTFTCERRRVMLGSPNRTCLVNGFWSGEETRCLGPREAMTNKEAGKLMGSFLHKMSMDVRTSDEQWNDMKVYQHKEVVYGKHVMSGITLNGKTAILDLMDSNGLDLYFLIDTSGSITKKDMTFTGNFITNILEKLGAFSESQDDVWVSLCAFNNTVWKKTLPSDTGHIDLKENLKEIISEKPRGGTSMGSALEELTKVLIPDAKSTGGREAPSAVVIITDGLSNVGRTPLEVAKELGIMYRNFKMEYYVIGVGNANKELLKEMGENLNVINGPENLIFVEDRKTLDVVSTILASKTDYSECGLAGDTQLSSNSKVAAAKPGAWPWMAAVFHNKDADSQSKVLNIFQGPASKHVCGATVIKGDDKRSKYLLSAAHCFSARPHRHEYAVALGSISSKKDLDDAKRLIFKIKRIIPHRDFDSSTMANDIAIVELNDPTEFRNDIRPVCLPNLPDETYRKGRIGVVTGWGKTHTGGKASENLKQLHVEVQDIEQCAKNITTGSELNSEWNFCAGGLRDKAGKLIDACKGDSGGPLVVWSKDQESGDTRFTQAGVVSFGEDCGKSGKPGVYTLVPKFLPWIDEVIACLDSGSSTCR